MLRFLCRPPLEWQDLFLIASLIGLAEYSILVPVFTAAWLFLTQGMTYLIQHWFLRELGKLVHYRR